nr:hypothetical protein [Staphylococcus debuckii]
MKRNIKIISLFVIAVVILVAVMLFVLNRKDYNRQTDLSEKKITGHIAKEDVDYKTVENKKIPVYKNIDKYLKKRNTMALL